TLWSRSYFAATVGAVSNASPQLGHSLPQPIQLGMDNRNLLMACPQRGNLLNRRRQHIEPVIDGTKLRRSRLEPRVNHPGKEFVGNLGHRPYRLSARELFDIIRATMQAPSPPQAAPWSRPGTSKCELA